MNKLITFLKGRKTFIMAACLFLTYGAEGTKLISPEVATILKGIFSAGGLAALRSAVRQ